MHLPLGTLLQGDKYKIERYISSGGFGCTYEARHVMLNNTVAIKEFFVKDYCNRDATTNRIYVATQSKEEIIERLRKKFVEEARAIFGMNHPNIVRVTDIFEENGTVYYVMDYINGSSLASVIEKHGVLGEAEAMGYIKQIASALAYVHSRNRLHLDVKPQNIMIDQSGKAVLIDFGVSKQYDEVNGENTSTLLGCTPGYAPIEQIGNGVVHFYPSADIYALGATLYKALTGVTPVAANLRASGEELPLLPADISLPTRTAVEAAMQINKAHRPQSVEEFLSLLESTDNRVQSTDNRVQSTDNRVQRTDKREQGEDLIDDVDVELTVAPDKREQRTDNRVQRVNVKALEAESEETRAVEKETEQVAITNNEPAEPKKNSTAWVVVVLGVLIGCGLFFAFSGSDSIEESASSSSVRTFTVDGVEFKMVAVKGGTFEMGATSEQQDTYDNERPVHSVTLSDYYIGETEVTQALWQAVMGSNPSNFTGNSQRPVECVSWDDCQTFISRLNAKTGMNFRLPTEAEWEYAARGGNRSNKTQYSGSSNIDNVAWYWENSSSTTHPVKGKSPNELGLYDMSGNVYEWCNDWYSSDYYSNSPRNNPQGPSSGSGRVLRGGSWYGNARYCRVADRGYYSPDGRFCNYGLRLAL